VVILIGTEAVLIIGTEAVVIIGTEAVVIIGTEAVVIIGTEAVVIIGTEAVERLIGTSALLVMGATPAVATVPPEWMHGWLQQPKRHPASARLGRTASAVRHMPNTAATFRKWNANIGLSPVSRPKLASRHRLRPEFELTRSRRRTRRWRRFWAIKPCDSNRTESGTSLTLTHEDATVFLNLPFLLDYLSNVIAKV
jgi:hypothetical protein